MSKTFFEHSGNVKDYHCLILNLRKIFSYPSIISSSSTGQAGWWHHPLLRKRQGTHLTNCATKGWHSLMTNHIRSNSLAIFLLSRNTLSMNLELYYWMEWDFCITFNPKYIILPARVLMKIGHFTLVFLLVSYWINPNYFYCTILLYKFLKTMF